MDKRFNKMIGITYMWGSQNHKIETIDAMAEDRFMVTTQLGQYTVDKDELQNDFLLVDSGLALDRDKIHDVFTVQSVQLNQVSDILLKTIKKLEIDPEYIEQSKAIAETAKSLIEIKKTQIELLKVLKS